MRLDDDTWDNLKREATRRGLDDIAPLVREYISAGLAHFDPTVHRILDAGERVELQMERLESQQNMVLSLGLAALGTMVEIKARSLPRLPDESEETYRLRVKASFEAYLQMAVEGAPGLLGKVGGKLNVRSSHDTMKAG